MSERSVGRERTDERVAQYLRLYSCLFQTTVQREKDGTNHKKEEKRDDDDDDDDEGNEKVVGNQMGNERKRYDLKYDEEDFEALILYAKQNMMGESHARVLSLLV